LKFRFLIAKAYDIRSEVLVFFRGPVPVRIGDEIVPMGAVMARRPIPRDDKENINKHVSQPACR
jgi:hypothetical protein